MGSNILHKKLILWCKTCAIKILPSMHNASFVSMQQQIPVFLKAVREDGTSYDQMKYGPVMTKLLQNCYAPFGAVEPESSTHGTSMKAGVDDNEPLIYFPHLKKCRCRGNYIALNIPANILHCCLEYSPHSVNMVRTLLSFMYMYCCGQNSRIGNV